MANLEPTLIQGDCLDLVRLLPDESINMVLTSPPYDNLRDYDSISLEDISKLAKHLYRALCKGGVVVWVVGDATVDGSETGTSFKHALTFMSSGFKLHDTMIYEKSGMAYPDSNRYHNVFEYMFIFSKDKPKTVNLIKDRPNKWVGKIGGNKRGGLCHRKQHGARFNIWRYANGLHNSSKDKLAFKHPAIMPEQLAIDHLITWSNQGDIVLDPFMGSGTTGVACKKTNRQFIGIEKNIEYFHISKERINACTI